MECARDSFSSTFGEATETHRKRVSHALKKEFFQARDATKYIYSNIPEVNFSVDNSWKRIVGLDF